MSLLKSWKFWVALIVVLVWARVPWFIRNNYQLQVLFRITLFAALGLAWNLVGGYAGQLSLGHVAFFGVGEDFTTKAFVMVVLGGMGSIEGAAFGGLVLGLSESLTSLYLGNQWALIIDFVLFLLVLSFKPAGIFGRQRA